MRVLWFWNSWPKEYRILWYGFVTVFIGALLFLWSGYFTGANGVIEWEKFQDQKTIETVSHSFLTGNFEFSIPIESYITFEYFNGGSIHPNTIASYIFISTLVLASILLLTVITTFNRFWYIVGTGLFILFIVSLRLEVLRLFGYSGQWASITVIAFYVVVSFYFNAFNTVARFTVRLISFLLITLVLGVVIYFFAGVPFPFLHLSVTGYIPGMIFTVIFTIMIAHEIIASFVYLTSQGTTSSKSLRHFMIISVVYMTNLFLAYLHEANIIHWNFLYINLYLLLTTSVMLSLWGYQQRESLYVNITRFSPFGAYFLIGLGMITFSTIGMLLFNANDPALKVIRDFIIFSHIGFGLMFLLYIISNFILLMTESLNVYKVLYTPNRMPYFTYRLAGLITMLAFVFYSNWREYVFHGSSGFYNSLGDLYNIMEKDAFAEAYYEQGRSFGFQNNRSNYILADRATRRNDLEKGHYHYEMANAKRPTEFSSVNAGNLYLFENKLFNSIFSFRDGIEKFPDSGPLNNNLGYAYSKIHLLDSSFFMLDKARQKEVSKETAEMNFAAVVAQEYLPVQADSIIGMFSKPTAGVISNAIVIATTQNQSFTYSVNPLESRFLDLYAATLLNNYIVNKVKVLDTAFTQEAYRIAKDSVNEGFSEALKASLAQAFYHQHNVSKAFEIIAEIAYLSQSRQGKYNYLMGLWALEQGDPTLAVQCFEYAVEYSFKEAKLYYAIALAEAGLQDRARIAADSLVAYGTEAEKEIGGQLKKILTIALSDLLQQTDLEKYQYCRYRIKTNDVTDFDRIVTTFQDPNYKAQALLEMAQRQFNAGNTTAAIQYFTKLEGLPLTDKILHEKIQRAELELLASRGEVRLLATKINDDGITFDAAHELEKLLYTAMVSEVSGDTTVATKNYEVLAAYNPFFEEGIIAAARYFKKHSSDPMKAYTILTDAIHVNRNSVRLLNAYIAEAVRMGFDNYAADANLELEKLKAMH